MQMIQTVKNLPDTFRQYLLITINYWCFTLTDGALRMLVVLYFYQLGYGALEIALLFVFYELFGVVTNLFGGWLGARIGLNRTMNIGLFTQVIALGMLLVPSVDLTVTWVMAAQALSGIAKDLNKMSAKSAVKSLAKFKFSKTSPLTKDAISKASEARLFKLVAILTGSKNTLKGVGFFLGGALLAMLGFQGAVLCMLSLLCLTLLMSLIGLKQDIGKANNKPKFKHIFAKSRAINILSAARLFFFCSRVVWFLVALPVYLSAEFNWSHEWVGGFLAAWVILYGVVQSNAPKLIDVLSPDSVLVNNTEAKMACFWGLCLTVLTALIAMALVNDLPAFWVLMLGLAAFAIIFAINSSLHSFLVVHYASEDGVSLDVGFYYMANAMGRLMGTILSGYLYQSYGLTSCIIFSAVFLLAASVIAFALPNHSNPKVKLG
jgi:MFS family permease